MLNSLRSLVKKSIKAELLEFCQLPDKPQNSLILDHYLNEINAAHFHPFQAGGKLIRPLLLVLTAGSIGNSKAVSNSLSAAAAIECVHTYSLVHDDLPCMDNDDLRRGQPTTHITYGEAKGLLVGDGLLTAAFSILSNSRSLDENLKNRSDLILKMMHIFTDAVSMRGMIWGQWLDISETEFIKSLFTTEKEEIETIFKTVHHNKTGKLFAASFVIGMLSGIYTSESSFSKEKLDALTKECFQIGLNIGLSFQILDDILDTTQTTETLGKTAGKDLNQDKLTAIRIFGLEKAKLYSKELIEESVSKIEDFISKTLLSAEQNNDYLKVLIDFLYSLSARKY